MRDINEIASRMTRSEFLNWYSSERNYCPKELGISELNIVDDDCEKYKKCFDCIKEAIKNIKFKDDLENETFEAECIDGIHKILTEEKIYPVKQSKEFSNYYEVKDDTGHVDTYFKTRFKPLESQEDTPIEHCIKLKNIDLTGISLPEELDKRDEEYKEFRNAILEYLMDNTQVDHLKEEACDVIQVVLSILKILGIDIPEIVDYWNTKHLEKLKDRPRKESRYTGINDVNGYRIYEGNIVYQKSVLVGSPDIDFEGEVKFYDGSWWIDDGKSAIYLFNESCENKIVKEA